MTAAQRATLEQMADQRTSRGAYGQGWREIDREELDALRAALGTCGNCAHSGEQPYEGANWTFCAAEGTDELFPFKAKAMPLGERCTGWTAKEGA